MAERDKPKDAEGFGPAPHKYDPVLENYRGNRNALGEFTLRDPKNRKRTWPNNQMSDGVDFDPHRT